MDIKKLKIPKSHGCYFFKDQKGKIIYIGKAADLRSRVFSYFRESADLNGAKRAMMKVIAKIEWIETESEIEALLLESNLIKKHQPDFNILMRDDKRYQYIKITTSDEIPSVFTARAIDRSGIYFGPYTGGLAVKETLKALRKIWPYCTQRKIGKKICFYAQVGRCTGVCGGEYPLKEYNDKVIKPIKLFLEGKKNSIIKKLEVRRRNLEREIKKCGMRNVECGITKSPLPRRGAPEGRGGLSDEETGKRVELEMELSEIKYQLLNMHNVLEHARILSIGEKYAADVVELAKVLGLSRVPERIEGYDISNIFGRAAVGSMVVFSGGEPDKNEYRKFKIRLGQPAFASPYAKVPADKKATAGKGRSGIDIKKGDVQMLVEVLERRFKHSGAPKALESALGAPLWAMPDLIIIDGGKAQLNAVLRVFKKNKLDISMLAVSKGAGLRSALAPDKIFWPGEKNPLFLPLASPALHIIKRVRDEAHRFAIGYHRLLRKKKVFDK